MRVNNVWSKAKFYGIVSCGPGGLAAHIFNV